MIIVFVILALSATEAVASHVKFGADLHEIYGFGKDVLAFVTAHGGLIFARKHYHGKH